MADFITQLDEAVSALKRLLTTSSTSEVTGMLYAMRMRFVGDKRQANDGVLQLDSPARQQAFLLGLLLATEEPAESQGFGVEAWEECVKLLNEAFGLYQRLFLPDKPGEQTEEWWRAREVAGPVFMHYFNTSLIATGDQIKARVQEYCVPFDAELVAATGVSASDSLRIMTFIADALQQNVRTMEELQPQLEGEQERFFSSGDFLRRDDPDYPEFMRAHYPILDGYFSRFHRMGQIAYAELQAAFPEQVDAFWAHYAVGRGQGSALHNPTEDSVFDFKPLVILDDGYAICPSANNLYEATLRACEVALDSSAARRRVFQHRDKMLEREGTVQFQRFLGSEGQVFTGVFETPDSHNEHDLLIVVDNTVLIVEAKASPPIEPSRTPERAFERLQQSFRKDTGIQKGFEQAARIQRRLATGEAVALYSRTGELLLTLNPAVHTECFCICLTRDDFGHMATNLSLLLEKDPTEPYPWAVCIWDLEAIADAWSFLNWGFHKLKEYLCQRQVAHGLVLGSDELEFVGAFIHHGNLELGREQGYDIIQLNPNYSDFFDELFAHSRYGAPAPDHRVVKPVLLNLRESLKAGQPVLGKGRRPVTARQMDRNAPCFCGSGAKYKKCHGR